MVEQRDWGRKSDVDILHAAKSLIQCELVLRSKVRETNDCMQNINSQIDKLLGLVGLTREEVVKGVEECTNQS